MSASTTELQVITASADELLGYEAGVMVEEGCSVLLPQTLEEHEQYEAQGIPSVYPRQGQWTVALADLITGWNVCFTFPDIDFRIETAKLLDGLVAECNILKITEHRTLIDWLTANDCDIDALYDQANTQSIPYRWTEDEADHSRIVPLLGQPIPQAPFPVDALGPIMGPITRAIVSNVQVSTPLAAQSVLAVASFTAQQFADVQQPYLGAKPKPCSLFFLTIAESGERKSSSNDVAMMPVMSWQKHLAEQYELLNEEYCKKERIYNKLVSKAEAKGKNVNETLQAIDALGDKPLRPLSPTLVLNEPTTEGFLKSAEYSHAGRAIMTDEAGTFLGGHSMTSEKRQHTLTTLSRLWDGASVVMARVGRETPPVRNKRLTMHLMGQGVVINPLLSDPLAKGQGFLARFLTVSAAPRAGFRDLKLTYSKADCEALDAWHSHIQSIWSNRDATMQTGTRNELKPPVLSLSNESLKIWIEFERLIESSQKPDGRYSNIKPFASKAAEHALRLAGVFTVIEQPEGSTEIKADAMKRSVELLKFYTEEHLRLIRQASADPKLTDAGKLLDWVKENRPRLIYKNDLRQNGPGNIRVKLDETLQTLLDHGLIKGVEGTVINGKKRQNCYEVIA